MKTENTVSYRVINPGKDKVIFFFGGIKSPYTKFANIYKAVQPSFTGVYFDTPLGGWNVSHLDTVERIILQLKYEQALAVGISSGACFSLTLASRGLLDRVFSVAGSLYKGFQPLKQNRIFMLNGFKDQSVPIQGGYIHKMNLLAVKETFNLFLKPEKSSLEMHYPNTTLDSNESGTKKLIVVGDASHNVWGIYNKKLGKDNNLINLSIQFLCQV